MKTVKFITLGCKVNQYETQSIREDFNDYGFRELAHNRPCDIYVINTCTVTQKADRESLYWIRRCFRENPQAKIVVTGCLTELDKEVIARQPGSILIVKNKEKNRILKHFFKDAAIQKPGISNFKGHNRAFLKIQDGCDNFCSYCKVALVRGKSRSVPLAQLLVQANALVKNGYREIVLTGVCLGSYGKDLKPKISLVDLISALEKIEGLWRIRLSSIEAKDVTDALIDMMAVSKKLCRHLHIPIQSGDDRILKLMNRNYTHQDYLKLIDSIKRRIPGFSLTTDIIVGFPGEDALAFNNTVKLIGKICPLKVHIFPYSSRLGTKAALMKNFIEKSELKKRLLELRKASDFYSLKFKKRFLNKTAQVLIESRSKALPFGWEGYSDNFLRVIVSSKKDLFNKLISLRIKSLSKDFDRAEFA